LQLEVPAVFFALVNEGKRGCLIITRPGVFFGGVRPTLGLNQEGEINVPQPSFLVDSTLVQSVISLLFPVADAAGHHSRRSGENHPAGNRKSAGK
jgi:hypothetical protein